MEYLNSGWSKQSAIGVTDTTPHQSIVLIKSALQNGDFPSQKMPESIFYTL